ncbi:MAG TPA: 30S ribosomal protein S9 [Parafilimonas sp.]|nr:30S ribosomal protein S9 [Parafilimonas sp.]
MEKQKNAVGRRKEAVTRVFINKGNGKITVNDKDYKEYFSLEYLQNQVESPLKTIESLDKFDVVINASGGGVKGQAEAAKLGIARGLLEINPEYRPVLKAAGLLKRRPEAVVERAIKGMLPKNRLGRKMFKKLFVYTGDQHPHTAQQPKELKF